MAAAASSSVALTLLPDYLQATASFLTRQGQQTLYLLHLVFPLSYFFGGCGGNKPVSYRFVSLHCTNYARWKFDQELADKA